jgi:hypothetical protein
MVAVGSWLTLSPSSAVSADDSEHAETIAATKIKLA